jgi:hypothetical protein
VTSLVKQWAQLERCSLLTPHSSLLIAFQPSFLLTSFGCCRCAPKSVINVINVARLKHCRFATSSTLAYQVGQKRGCRDSCTLDVPGSGTHIRACRFSGGWATMEMHICYRTGCLISAQMADCYRLQLHSAAFVCVCCVSHGCKAARIRGSNGARAREWEAVLGDKE